MNKSATARRIPLPEYIPDGDTVSGALTQGNGTDPLFEEAARFIVSSNTASTSSLQRRYNIGYNRAGRLIDQMEAAGIVGPASGAKAAPVLSTHYNSNARLKYCHDETETLQITHIVYSNCSYCAILCICSGRFAVRGSERTPNSGTHYLKNRKGPLYNCIIFMTANGHTAKGTLKMSGDKFFHTT